ncbi:MAG: hypothetical protein IPQ05_06370 [Leptospiraceae bacterium]|nr:hypothetical protein [Leptospiraceae bacterium]
MQSRILGKSNKSIEPIACDSSADGERLSDGGTNPPLGVNPTLSAGNAGTHLA